MPGLMRYARSLVADEARAEDLVQQTLVKSLEKLHTFRADASLATWLHRILYRVAVDQGRRTREVPVDDLASVVESHWRDDHYTVDAALVASRAETRRDLRDALLRLPVIYRSAVVLHDMEGMTVPEIARVQDVSLPAAKQRLRRGRMMLVTALASGPDRRAARQGVALDCWSARIMVPDYLDDDLVADERRLLEQHLERCPTCPALYAGLVSVTQAVSRMRDADSVVPDAIAQRLHDTRHSAGP